jgi:NAD(P)-dependent dehydrogenase (short-subunit alcohol dehydrogenase family)
MLVSCSLPRGARPNRLVDTFRIYEALDRLSIWQGYDLQMGTNCVGPYLFTKLLLPTLQRTAASSPPASVRVTWAASSAVDLLSPKPGGVVLDAQGAPKNYGPQFAYGQSKVGNVFLAHEFAKRYGKDGIISNVSFASCSEYESQNVDRTRLGTRVI